MLLSLFSFFSLKRSKIITMFEIIDFIAITIYVAIQGVGLAIAYPLGKVIDVAVIIVPAFAEPVASWWIYFLFFLFFFFFFFFLFCFWRLY